MISALSVVCILVGYFLQSLYAIIAGKKRLSGTYAYEDNSSKFRSSQAVLPIIIAVAIAVITRYIVEKMYRESAGSYYDEYSPVPYVAAVVVFLLILSGIAMWFYSPIRLASLKVFLPATAIMLIEYAFSFFVGGTFGNVFALCAIIFFTCAVILMNQVYIQRTFKGSVVSVITPQARFYNIWLAILLILFAFLLFLFIYVIFTGISILLKIALFFILGNILRETPDGTSQYYDSYDSSEIAGEFMSMVFGQKGTQSAQTQFIFAVFVVIVIAFILFLILRKKISLKKIYAAFHAWIQNIIAFFAVAYDFNRIKPNKKNINYKDEEEKLQDKYISSNYERKMNAMTYRDFQHQMAKLKTYDEKIGYAYKTLLQMYQKMNLKLKSSDTPRETKVKIQNGMQSPEIGDITEAIELVKYAELELDKTDSAKAEQVLSTMCNTIKKYMY